MRLRSVSISNYRSIKEISIEVENLTSLIGQNGAGKSNLLRALNVFFGKETINSQSDEDWYQRDTGKKITIELTFDDLNEEEKGVFEHYHRDGELIIEFGLLHKQDGKYHGYRLVNQDFATYFRADKEGKSAKELQSIYETLRETYKDLQPERVKGNMEASLRYYEEKQPKSEKVLIASEDIFYGGKKGNISKLLEFVEWVYVPAVSDITEETETNKKSTLGQLLKIVADDDGVQTEISELELENRTRLEEIIDNHSGALLDLSSQLSSELRIWAHEDSSVDVTRQIADASLQTPPIISEIKEGSFFGPASSFGHGLHRSYLFALLNVLAEINRKSIENGEVQKKKNIIFAIEEPELYQHPFQIRRLSALLRRLSDEGRFQTIFTTHSPLLLQPDTLNSVIRIYNGYDGSQLVKGEIEEIDWPTGKIHHDIYRLMTEKLSEMLFADKVVLVEGKTDPAYIHTYWKKQYNELVPVPVIKLEGKGELPKAIRLANVFKIDYFVVFDADKQNHEYAENQAVAAILAISEEDNLGVNLVCKESCLAFPNKIEDTINSEMPNFNLEQVKKYPLIAAERLQQALDSGDRSPTMEALCEAIRAKFMNEAAV